MNAHIFREYDIRGIADTDLNDLDVLLIGRALGTYYVQNGVKSVVVGQDVRLTSPRIATALTRGLTAAGIDVVRVGMVPTPAVYFAIHEWGMDGGVAVTGSHNPVEFNGFKMNLGAARSRWSSMRGTAAPARTPRLCSATLAARSRSCTPSPMDVFPTTSRIRPCPR
ncbi:MAG: phosphomannomutase / phosphoglucomutase [bacterium]|nr:MAG: phosphomannomutase / phosphoglucomutase [bacterium]